MVRRLNGRLPWLVACVAGLSLALAVAGRCPVHRDDQRRRARTRRVSRSRARRSPSTCRKASAATSKPSRTRRASSSRSACRAVRYKVTAEKDKLSSNHRRRARQHQPAGRGQPRARRRRRRRRRPSKETAAKNAELKKAFEEGVAASRAGNHDDAIAKFTASAALNAELLRLLLQHRLLGVAEEGLRQGRKRRTRKRSRSSPTTPKPTAAWRTSTTPRGSSIRRRRRARRRWSSSGGAPQPAAAAATPTRCSTRASSCGTPARSPTRRSSSKARSPRTRTTPNRTISSGWRW